MVRRRERAWRDYLIAAAQDSHLRRARDLERRASSRRRQRNGGGVHETAGAEQYVADFEIHTGIAYVAPCCDWRRCYLIAVANSVLLDQHTIGAIRKRRPSKDARAFAGVERAIKCAAGAGFADHAQDARCVCGAEGIAVHRRGAKRWLGAGGDNIFAERSSARRS